MKIPPKVPCASHWYEIKFNDILNRDDGSRGHILFNQHLIELDPIYTGSTFQVCFWHEIIHMIDKHYGDDCLNETKTAALAEGFAQLMQYLGITFERG